MIILTFDPITEEGKVIFKLGLEYEHTSVVEVGVTSEHPGLLGVIVDGNVIIRTLDAYSGDLCRIVNE